MSVRPWRIYAAAPGDMNLWWCSSYGSFTNARRSAIKMLEMEEPIRRPWRHVQITYAMNPHNERVRFDATLGNDLQTITIVLDDQNQLVNEKARRRRSPIERVH